ncbi:GH51 arabinofuranosidase [Westerdykella ornata]|uniref:non-reducing end alpha-L-arabinofuranosidase n=1 Tax=Westerdykella ornata TaxID=318751 RepID=A0A6A6J8W5_WESOR|nr:GH51 arabinofuranosidase [Westerdykella ornata]KAF2272644.1 GH51 arabinofuranosidase [Westerdykella ornata]
MLPTLVATVLAALATTALSVDIVVHKDGGNKTSDMPYGLMHEDINYAGDGGIYAELIRNRAFQGSKQFPVSLSGWSPINGAQLTLKQLSKPLSSALPNSMNVAVGNASKPGPIGFSNSGFWGMDVKKQPYKGSFYVKGAYKGKFTASLQSAITKETFGSVEIVSKSVENEWVQHKFTLVPTKNAKNGNNTFALTFRPEGVQGKAKSLDFNLISLFPPTYKGRENGLRVDLAEAFAALEPKFLRFPGGNALEGPDLANPWKWNETLGPLKDRPGRPGVWGYQMSDGLGLMEYLQWAEDMNLEPILAVWAGLALDGAYVNETDLQPWIQDALNEIEFVRGPATSPYGSLRARLGHPEPFPLKYVEIGNEDWLAGRPAGFESYIKYRFPLFKKAISEKYPDIQIIASPSVFDDMTIPAPVAGDYHPYREPDEFYNEFHKFDGLTRDNKTLIGEYAAVHANGGIKWDGGLHPFPWWIGAVGEAIFLISAENAGDRILGATYAPILRNMNSWSWSVCMIEFEADTSKTTLSTSYHLFKLFSTKPITRTLPTTPGERNTTSLFWGAGVAQKGGRVVKFANYNTTGHADTPVSVRFEGVREKKATLTVLTGKEGAYGFNDPERGNEVVRQERRVLGADREGRFVFRLPELSVATLEVGRRGDDDEEEDD